MSAEQGPVCEECERAVAAELQIERERVARETAEEAVAAERERESYPFPFSPSPSRFGSVVLLIGAALLMTMMLLAFLEF